MNKSTCPTIRMTGALLLGMLLLSCAPAMYKGPITNFEQSTQSAKEIYFSRLKAGHDSFITRQEAKLKLDILTADQYDFKSENHLLQQERIRGLYGEKSIPEASLKLRQRAFEVLQYYGKTLQVLADNENTDALKTELVGLTEDLAGLVETAETLASATEAFRFLAPVADWAGPIGSAADVLEQIVQIVSDYIREKAIREAILTADPMVQELLGLLQEEAVTATEFQQDNYQQTARECSSTIRFAELTGAAQNYLAYELCAGYQKRAEGLPDAAEIKEVFQLVRDSHTEMKAYAETGDFEKMIQPLRKYQERIDELKTKFVMRFTD